MSTIKQIKAIEILDSRGNPTIEATVILSSGQKGSAKSPSGASTGSREALELRDHDAKRYLGKGVLKAVHAINHEISAALSGFTIDDQQKLDETLIALDGTDNKGRLGANATLAVSMAACHARAADKQLPLYQVLGGQAPYLLPVPMMNIINGGVHADNNLDIQEFMIIPLGADTLQNAIRAGAEVFHHLKKILHSEKYNTNVGDEGGFAPNLSSHAMALEIIVHAIKQAGYAPRKDIALGLDVASNELYRDGQYHLTAEKKHLSAEGFIDYLEELVTNYPIISIEDAMSENDWKGWQQLTKRLGDRVQLVGDDLFVTNTAILQKGIHEHLANAILIKPNQIGTVTETLAAIQMAKKARYNTIISHRSGETEDSTIADLSVATNAGQIKTGSLCRSDRVAKYNRLLHIAAELQDKAYYAGRTVFERK